jgi:hypothetical protein
MTPEQSAAINQFCMCDDYSNRIEDAIELIEKEPKNDFYYSVLMPIKLILQGINDKDEQ